MAYVNVHYKFVVDHTKDYKAQELDPNVPLDPADIVRIIAPYGNACPICLSDEPVAPRMIVLCGHILCLKCLLSLLDSEVPKAKKKESDVIVEKYRECPLCLLIIRKNEIKPVLVENVDERLETPKVGEQTVLTLMSRPVHSVLALPQHLSHWHEIKTGFPWVDEEDFSQYSRIFQGDLKYLLTMYELEKECIKKVYDEEHALYGETDKFMKMAIANIDSEIAEWSQKMPPQPRKAAAGMISVENKYYYYQTGFNSSAVYVMALLDAKVLKTCYHSYSQLPLSIVAKIENIRYEELTTETALSKYKYLSHLPAGTQVGFLECDWSGNEYVNKETWAMFKEELTRRSRNSQRKVRKEERDRIRAQNEEEARTRDFYERENGLVVEEHPTSSFSNLTLADYTELPALEDLRNESSGPDTAYTTTVWGTKIPKAEEPLLGDEDSWDTEEMIRRAKEEMKRLDGKKKKKVVLW